MKLSRIFANKSFKNVKFSDGLNVIIGKISDRNNRDVDSHNLGKTLLIEVIDFLLLKEIKDKSSYFLTKHVDIFSEYIFFGEIQLNNGKYLVIRRAVSNNTKISFKLINEQLKSFDTTIGGWDYENITLNKSKEILNGYLNFDVAKNYNYRKSLNYFMRNQYDYNDVFKLSKFLGKHRDWKPLIFELLGFNGEFLYKKMTLDDEFDTLSSKLSILEKENKVTSEDEDRIIGLIDISENKLADISVKIDKFDFYDRESHDIDALVNNLEAEIQAYNSESYAIQYEISKIEKSLSNVVDYIDMESILELYEEVKIIFPNSLIKEYDQVLDFNNKISQERRKFLNDNLASLKINLEEVQTSLRFLESKKSEIFSNLTEKTTYEKFKIYQKDLAKTEADILVLKEKLNNINSMTKLQNEINIIKSQIADIVASLKHQISEQKHKHIRQLFNDFTSGILNTTALISVRTNKNDNVDFIAEYSNENDLISTDLSKGYSYKKILCAAFDTALLQQYRQHSFFRFVYHDGVLDSLDIRKKEKYIEYVRNLAQTQNLQYIITVIESEVTGLQEEFMFKDDEICLTLSDQSCKDKLFEQCF
ncbi:MAG: DUF2326 domain-containing protein [Neisseriaceae bacterium]|nr:MAG: DUF2326 domain-containing protein [Neisseriaceae bacterium]